MNIGERYKYYREKVKLTQKEAAELLGVKSYQLANYETNRTEPNIQTLINMSSIYKVTIDELLNNKVENKNDKSLHSADYDDLLLKINEFVKNINNNK